MVPESKKALIVKFLFKKVFKDVHVSEEGFNMPFKNGKSTGCAFLTFPSASEAEEAQAKLDNQAIDKKHTLRATTFKAFDELMQPDREQKGSSSQQTGNHYSLKDLQEFVVLYLIVTSMLAFTMVNPLLFLVVVVVIFVVDVGVTIL